jgi:hypothetical protein
METAERGNMQHVEPLLPGLRPDSAHPKELSCWPLLPQSLSQPRLAPYMYMQVFVIWVFLCCVITHTVPQKNKEQTMMRSREMRVR